MIVTGCWATSDRTDAAALPGVDAVIGHQQDVAAELSRLLDLWQGEPSRSKHPDTRDCGQRLSRLVKAFPAGVRQALDRLPPLPIKPVTEPTWNEGWNDRAGSPAGGIRQGITPPRRKMSTEKWGPPSARCAPARCWCAAHRRGPASGRHLKVQDGCDAHCTYCIIPRLRPAPRSKPVDDAVAEARRLVAAGHVELVLTGIFLGAYGRRTALRRRQGREPRCRPPSGRVWSKRCAAGRRAAPAAALQPRAGRPERRTVAALRSYRQVVPHFHLPLQSGSDALLRRMNRQYTRDDYLRMVDRVRAAFDRPGSDDRHHRRLSRRDPTQEFRRTLEVVESAAVHPHPRLLVLPPPRHRRRPVDAASSSAGRWSTSGSACSAGGPKPTAFAFRQQFVGENVELLVERDEETEPSAGGPTEAQPPTAPGPIRPLRHGRSERYFAVHFEDELGDRGARPGDFVPVRIDKPLVDRTLGIRVPSADDRAVAG